MSQGVIFVIGLIVYVAFMIFIGWITTRGKSDGTDYLDGGRKVAILPLIGTIVATCVGTGSSMGAAGNGYLYGWAGALVGLGNSVGMLCMLWFMRMRKFKFTSMVTEAQFLLGGSKQSKTLLAIAFFLIEIMWTGSHINGGSKYLCYVTGMNDALAKTLITIGFLGYAYFGGYMAVVWTDTVQLGIILFGFITIVIRSLPMAGGFGAIREAYTAAGNAGALGFYGIGSYGIMAALTLIVASFFNVISVPVFHTRLFSAGSDDAAKKSFSSGFVIDLLFSFLPAIIGMCAFTICSGTGSMLDNSDFAFSYMATTALGPIAGLLFLIAGLSATMSSADSDLLSGVTILVADIYPMITHKTVDEKKYKGFSRLCMLIAVAIAYLFALYAKDIIGYITNVAGSMLPGVGVMMILGRFWKRITWQGGLASVVGGILFGICYLVIAPFHAFIAGIFSGPAIPVTILTLILCVVVSLLTPACTLSDEEKLALVNE
ncbi:MAG: sodium:solute symporter family protein [Lachnospiraceae bacterium]|nr:sodium:solute symporter family protein [Lachnospiraceae bacterium]